jgi:hypothetical protein
MSETATISYTDDAAPVKLACSLHETGFAVLGDYPNA